MREDEQAALSVLHHDTWHETQAPLQDPRIAKYRGLSFFTTRGAERWPRTLVAESQGQLAGFACWTGAHFNSLFLAPGFRSGGIGSALLKASEIKMEKTTPRPFDLYCIFGNDAARRFYERHDWRLSQTVDRIAETPEGPALVKTWIMTK